MMERTANKLSSPIPHDHELRCGSAGGLAALAGQEHADFVILLAARTGFLLAGRSGAVIPNDITLAQVDLDGSEIGKSHAVNIGIVADVGLFCEAFLSKVDVAGFTRNEGWIQKCYALNHSALPYEKDEKVMPDGQIHVSGES